MESDDEGILAKILIQEGATGIEVKYLSFSYFWGAFCTMKMFFK
jgi:hypothetical protein